MVLTTGPCSNKSVLMLSLPTNNVVLGIPHWVVLNGAHLVIADLHTADGKRGLQVGKTQQWGLGTTGHKLHTSDNINRVLEQLVTGCTHQININRVLEQLVTNLTYQINIERVLEQLFTNCTHQINITWVTEQLVTNCIDQT